jgi:hypothetical protein
MHAVLREYGAAVWLFEGSVPSRIVFSPGRNELMHDVRQRKDEAW